MTTRTLALCTLILGTGAARANFFWNVAGPADWNTAANWGPDTAPFDNDRFVNNGGIATITSNATIAPIRDAKIGFGAGATGTVNHSAGTLTTPGWTFVGIDGGAGTYNLANTAGAGGATTGFAMGSGSLAAGQIRIGGGGPGSNGVFNMNTSGTVTAAEFHIGLDSVGDGKLNLDNGTINSDVFFVGTNGGANARMNMSGGSVNVTGFFHVGNNSGVGRLDISGGNITAAEFFAGNENVGGGNGLVNQSGGTVTGNNWVIVGRHDGSNGVYNISAGTLQTTNAGGGVFAVGHSSNVGPAKGVLNITGGNVIAAAEMWVGNHALGDGTVNQSAGSVSVGSWFAVGRDGGKGIYNLSGGTLAHTGGAHTIIGSLSGNGTVNQTGGIYNEVADLRLGENAGGIGTWNISAGAANVNGFVLAGWTGGGSGVLTISGTGQMTVNQNVEVGGGAGGVGNGTVNLDGGTLFTNNITRNTGGTALLNFNGGVFKAMSGQSEFLPNFNTATSEIKAGGMKVDTNGFDITTGVALDGAGGLTKMGNGVLTLSGASTYAGRTLVNAGTLRLAATGSLSPSNEVTVAAGATFDASAVAGGFIVPATQTLDGNGTVLGNTTINGKLAPGSSIGTLTITGNLSLLGISNYEIDRTGLPASDLTNVSGSVTYGGTLNVSLLGGTLQNGDTFNLFDFASASGSFASINLPNGNANWINNLGSNGTITYIPEPGAAGLAALGLVALMRRRRAV